MGAKETVKNVYLFVHCFSDKEEGLKLLENLKNQISKKLF